MDQEIAITRLRFPLQLFAIRCKSGISARDGKWSRHGDNILDRRVCNSAVALPYENSLSSEEITNNKP